jgi:hypothetical protein
MVRGEKKEEFYFNEFITADLSYYAVANGGEKNSLPLFALDGNLR